MTVDLVEPAESGDVAGVADSLTDDAARHRADGPGDRRAVAVNPEFLLQALDAGGEGQLVLKLDGPIRPLAIRTTGGRGHVSLPTPVRALTRRPLQKWRRIRDSNS